MKRRSHRIYDIAKRLLDVACSALLMLLLGPLLAVLAIAVRLQLGSPVFFTQERPGLKGRPFTLYKFRTMGVPDPGLSAAAAVGTDDARLTRFGRILRASVARRAPGTPQRAQR